MIFAFCKPFGLSYTEFERLRNMGVIKVSKEMSKMNGKSLSAYSLKTKQSWGIDVLRTVDAEPKPSQHTFSLVFTTTRDGETKEDRGKIRGNDWDHARDKCTALFFKRSPWGSEAACQQEASLFSDFDGEVFVLKAASLDVEFGAKLTKDAQSNAHRTTEANQTNDNQAPAAALTADQMRLAEFISSRGVGMAFETLARAFRTGKWPLGTRTGGADGEGEPKGLLDASGVRSSLVTLDDLSWDVVKRAATSDAGVHVDDTKRQRFVDL